MLKEQVHYVDPNGSKQGDNNNFRIRDQLPTDIEATVIYLTTALQCIRDQHDWSNRLQITAVYRQVQHDEAQSIIRERGAREARVRRKQKAHSGDGT